MRMLSFFDKCLALGSGFEIFGEVDAHSLVRLSAVVSDFPGSACVSAALLSRTISKSLQ